MPPAAGTALRDSEGPGAQHGPHSPTLGVLPHPPLHLHCPRTLPRPTLSLPLQLPGPGLDRGHLAFVGFQQLLWRQPVSLQWERLPGGLFLQHTGVTGNQGLGPQSWGAVGLLMAPKHSEFTVPPLAASQNRCQPYGAGPSHGG